MESLAVVVPTKGRDAIVARCLVALQEAVQRHGNALLVIVDNSGGGVIDPALEQFARTAIVIASDAVNVGGVRNHGVAAINEAIQTIAFVDSDCLVSTDFCQNISKVFDEVEAEVIGCKVASPLDGHWTEVASDALHRDGNNGYRTALNSGCLAVRRPSFEAVGGFSDTLPSNEDYDLCNRLRRTGCRIWQDDRLKVIHLGNPKTTLGFARRMVWHGKGVVAQDWRIDLSRMLMAVLLNAFALSIGLFGAVVGVQHGDAILGGIAFAASVVTIPFLFWLMRTAQLKRWIPVLPSLALLQITFLARGVGLVARVYQLVTSPRNARS